MAPTLRPRPSVARQPAPLAGDGKTSAAGKVSCGLIVLRFPFILKFILIDLARQRQVDSNHSLPPTRKPQAKRGRKKQQNRPTKARGTQGASPVEAIDSTTTNPRPRQRKPPSTFKGPNQTETRNSKQKQSKAGRQKGASSNRRPLQVREESDERLSPVSYCGCFTNFIHQFVLDTIGTCQHSTIPWPKQ